MVELSKFTSFFVANWKLNGSFAFINNYLDPLNNEKFIKKCVVLCPPSPYLYYIKDLSKNSFIGSQDCSYFEEGPYTGEISTKILSDLKIDFCIVGHSERRKYFEETNSTIKEKASKLIENEIIPIICVGETLEEKNNNLTNKVIKKQIEECMPKSAKSDNAIIAYEPVWAIGTGLTPTLNEIENSHKYIRQLNNEFIKFNILYGGSVNIKNSKQILEIEDVNGALIGGASLKIEDFIKIISNSS